MSAFWGDPFGVHGRGLVAPDPEQRRREAIESIARGLAALEPGESLQVEMHDDGTMTVTFRTSERAL